MRRALPVLLLVFLALTATAQPRTPTEFERVLLPVFLPHPLPGAYGTSWSTDTLLFNDSIAPIRMVPACDADLIFCDIQPRATFRIENTVTTDTPSHARFIHITREQAEQAPFSACLRHDDTDAVCTPLPVVREAGFHARIVLPFVPLRTNVRAALRVYGATPAATMIHLRMYRLDRLDPFVDEFALLTAGTPSTDDFVVEPSQYAVLDLVDHWPQLDAAASVRIEIDTVDPSARIWAFASVTSNTTQETALFRPE